MSEWGVTVLEANGELDAGRCGRPAGSDAPGGQEQHLPPRGPPCRARRVLEAVGVIAAGGERPDAPPMATPRPATRGH